VIAKKKKKKAHFLSTHHLVHHLALFIKNNEQSNKQKDNDYGNIPKKRVQFLVLPTCKTEKWTPQKPW
jgi:catechol-2,3-dioxygenase